jgi:hypothetical protein
LTKAREIIGNTVCQGSFELGPDQFIGVKLRSIPWEEVNMDSWMLVQELLDDACPVGSASVPHQYDGSPNMSQQVAEEEDHLLGPDVFVGVELKIQSHLSSLWRKTES